MTAEDHKTCNALRNLIANIEAGNATVEAFDGDNLNMETAQFYLVVKVNEGKELDTEITI